MIRSRRRAIGWRPASPVARPVGRLGKVLGVVALLVLGCGGDGGPGSEPRPEVWFDGCSSVRKGAADEPPWVCVRDPARPLRLWLPPATEPEKGLVPFFDDRRLQVGIGPRPEEEAVVLEELGPGRLQLRAGSSRSWIVWELGIVPPEASLRSLQEAREIASMDLEDALSLVAGELREAKDPVSRARSVLLLGRLERKKGSYELAEQYFLQAQNLFAASGHVSEQIVAGVLLFRLGYYDREDNAAAEQALEGLPEPPPGDLDSAYRTSFYPAVWAVRTGRFRAAEGFLDEALRHTSRSGDEGNEVFLQQMRAPLLSRFGRYQEAVALLTPFEDTTALRDCYLGQLIQNVAWNQLLAWEAWGGPERALRMGLEPVAGYAPIPRLERALQLLSSEECPEDEQVNIRFNLALAHFHRGQFEEAEEQLRAVVGETKAWHEVWALDLRGRLSLVKGEPEAALGWYRQLDELARRLHSSDAQWRALVGRGRALRALGRDPEALQAYAAAEELVNEEMLAVPVGAEQETSLQARAAGTRELLALLLDSGEASKALELARRSHSRAFRGLFETHHIADLDAEGQRLWAEISTRLRQLDEAEGRDWTVAGDRWEETLELRRQQRRQLLDRAHLLLGGFRFELQELPPLGPGEVTLLFHPLPEGWAGFAVYGERLEVRRIPRPAPGWLADDDSAAEVLLDPFAEILLEEGAERIRILAPGDLSGVDFHALPVRGEPLLAARAVVYGLDLGAPPAGADGPNETSASPFGIGNVLLVVDPRRNLHDAPAEGDAVAAALGRQEIDGRLRRLDHELATLEAVSGELTNASVLHFAGHADFTGRGGWDSGLALAGDTRLTVPSLLAMPSVPRTVVLSACESGASSEGPVEGLGLARAFVLAGAREVVGTVRPVADTTSRAVAEELYRHWDGEEPVAEALRRAQLALAAQDAGGDWRAFRVVER